VVVTRLALHHQDEALMAILKAKVNGEWVPVTAGGGASEEVFIGATDPGVTSTHELWFDSDAVSPADTSRWNSSWGVIAMGTFIPPYAPHTVTTTEPITNAVTATLITGRRYKIRLQIRAMSPTGGATQVSLYLSDNGTQVRGTPFGGDPYVLVTGAYQGANYEWQFTGDNTSHSFVVWVAPGGSTAIFTDYGLWYIEDAGPISYGIAPAIDPTPSAVAWTPMILLNGWLPFGASSSPPGYRKVGDMVQIRGTVKNPVAMTLPSTSTITNLPVGYRPPYNINLAASGTGADQWGAPATISVETTGDLKAVRSSDGPTTPHIYTGFESQFSVTP
jgi:hypothetical protein